MAQHLSEKLNSPYFEVALHIGKNIYLTFQTIAELVYRDKKGENWMAYSKHLIKNQDLLVLR